MMQMQLSNLMGYIPEKELQSIGQEVGVDKKNSKITGAFILKSFVRCSLLGRPISLRSIELLCNTTPSINTLLKSKHASKKNIDHSSLGKQLNKINPDYFERVYNVISEKADNVLYKKNRKKLYRFDSTITTLAGKLVKDGLNAGGTGKENQIKLTVGLRGALPKTIRFCKDKKESSEDIALVKAINTAKIEKEDIVLFDRGISKSSTYEDFSKENIKFVTRIKCNRKYLVKKKRTVKNTDTLKLLSDEIINFYNKSGKAFKTDLRLIKAINKHNTEIWFLSNLLDAPVSDVTELYSRRWDIEVFFKFIKQHLQFKHFISHSLNGMKIYMYSLLIAAILFLLFKELNNKTGFKIPLLEFTIRIEKEIIKDVIILSGGDLQAVQHLI